MIDWETVLQNAVWLVGLTLMLAVLSLGDYTRAAGRLRWKVVWTAISGNGWMRLGTLLFCAGMSLTADTWPEQAAWALLCLYILYEWVRALRRRQVGTLPLEAPPPGSTTSVAAPRIFRAARAVAEQIVRFELLWLALLSPLLLFPVPHTTGILALLALPLLWVLRRIAHGHFIPRTPLDWPICLLLVMVLVSTYTAFDLSYSLARISVLLFSVGVFYALIDWATNRQRAGLALGIHALLGVGLALLGLLAVDWVKLLGVGWGDKLFPALGQLRAQIPALLRGLPDTSRWLHPNEVGGALLWVVPLQFALLGFCWTTRFGGPVSRWVTRLALLPITLFTAATLVSTQARGVIVGCAIGLALLVWMLSRWWMRAVLLVLAMVGVVVLLYARPQEVLDNLASEGITGAGVSLLDSERSLEGRTVIWSRAIYAIEDFPITGIGLDTFRFVMPTLYPGSDSLNATTSHPHDHLFSAALELGLPGFVAYLGLWFGAAGMVVQAWSAARRKGDKWGRMVSMGIGACLLAYFMYGLTDVVSLGDRPGLLFWSLLGLLVVTWRLTAATPQPSPVPVTAEVPTDIDTNEGSPQESDPGQEADEPEALMQPAGEPEPSLVAPLLASHDTWPQGADLKHPHQEVSELRISAGTQVVHRLSLHIIASCR